MKNFLKEYLGSIIFTLVIVAIFVVAVMYGLHLKEKNKKEYNNGTCLECGGHYHLVSASYYRGEDTYYYECDNCGHIFKTNYNFK
jgi:NADH:ubiquinone oxidoreductase subunit 3 (subunit A)